MKVTSIPAIETSFRSQGIYAHGMQINQNKVAVNVARTEVPLKISECIKVIRHKSFWLQNKIVLHFTGSYQKVAFPSQIN